PRHRLRRSAVRSPSEAALYPAGSAAERLRVSGRPGTLSQITQVLAGLEADGLAWRDADFRAGPGVAADPFFSRLDLEDTEATQLDPFAAAHRLLHGVKDRLHGDHRLDAGDIGVFRYIINN